jgi:putative FmdB family regulatory protein
MPTYEYQCTACGHAFEKFQSIKAAPIKKCPQCGKSRVKRLIGMGAGLLFKGSGFYITDYRGDSYSKAAKADAAPTTTSGESKPATTDAPATPKADAKSAEAKSESKSEPKSEPKAQPRPEPKTASRSAKKR